MYWLILGVMVAFFVIRVMWRAYIHPSHVLGRQAANMNWIAVGRIPDNNGYKNVKLMRKNLEAVISYKNKNVELITPYYSTPFNDFIEVERWLTKNFNST